MSSTCFKQEFPSSGSCLYVQLLYYLLRRNGISNLPYTLLYLQQYLKKEPRFRNMYKIAKI